MIYPCIPLTLSVMGLILRDLEFASLSLLFASLFLLFITESPKAQLCKTLSVKITAITIQPDALSLVFGVMSVSKTCP